MSIHINYEEQLLSIVRGLSDAQKQRVLEYAQVVSRPEGERGSDIIEHAKKLNFDKQFLQEMKEAIEEECETVEPFKDVSLV